VSENASKPFATCILLRGDSIIATSNIAIVLAKSGLDVENDVLIHSKVADFILRNSDGISHMDVSKNHVLFHWKDGSVYNTTRVFHPFPDLEPVINSLRTAEWDVPAEWREAVSYLMKLGDDKERFEIRKDKLVSRTERSTAFEAEVHTPMEDDLETIIVESKFLGPVFAAAKKLRIYAGGPRVFIAFETDRVRGVAAGVKKN
jgi:hypothetical protein